MLTANCRSGLFGQREKAACIAQDAAALFSEGYRLREFCAFKERNSQFALQRLDLRSNAGLGIAKLGGGTGKTASLCHNNKSCQLLKIEHKSPD